MTQKKIWRLVKSIFLCELAGIIGSLATTPAIKDWYAFINKPSFNPPNWIFAPVWTALFALMGIALYLVWSKGEELKFLPSSENKKEEMANIRMGLKIFLAQLILNMLWSFLFFFMRNPLLAFVEIIILWGAILASIILFYKINKKAAYLLIPYILWVSFAVVLNFSIMMLNL